MPPKKKQKAIPTKEAVGGKLTRASLKSVQSPTTTKSRKKNKVPARERANTTSQPTASAETSVLLQPSTRQETDKRLDVLMKDLLSTTRKINKGDPTQSDDADTTATKSGEKEENLPEEYTPVCLDKNRLLNEACRRRKLEIVKELVSLGADINNRSVDGLTPVMIAAWTGDKDLFDFLVDQGCDMSVTLDNENNVLHVACFGGNVDIVSYLITENVVDIESKGKVGRTAVMKAAKLGLQEMFDLLVAKGSNLSAVDNDRKNILHLACLSDNVQIVQYLIDQGVAGIESRGQYGRTPVMFAAEKGNAKVFHLLVNRGCDLRSTDDDGNNILHLASFSDNVEILQYLISQNIADIDSRGDYGRTPLMFAAEMGHKEIFDVLVSAGSDLTAVDKDGNTMLHLASFSDNVEIIEYLITQNVAGIDSKGDYGRSPVMFAAEMGRKKVFDFLVSKGCDLSTVDDKGNNILHLTSYGDSVEIANYLIANEIAGVESQGQFGRTPVMLAAEKGQKAVFDLLANMGSDLTRVDDVGNSILHLAAAGGSRYIVEKLLKDTEVDVRRRNNRGHTAIDKALQNKHNAIARLLISRRDNTA